ncbi:YckD family protein [Dehalobacter sp. DCM]|uniref:DUF2680 domain-containing protein n=1 Tax=Dehalobacter sp. DCM TaxID=2907827 RepID=UPI00308192B7|nr:YckD family protein [Dehalobacter sp. DCM]
MKKVIIGVITAGLILVGAGTALAATYKSPAEIYAGLKGITVDQAYDQRESGKSFGQLAADAGLLEEFKEQMLINKKAAIQKKVTAGLLTQQEADALIQRIEANAAYCDGTGVGKGTGLGSGGKGFSGRGVGAGSGACCFGNGR